MNLQAEKIQLAKMVLDTENKNLIQAIKSVFKEWGNADNTSADATRIIESIKSGLNEVKLHQQGKIKLKPAKDLLDEL